MEVFRQKIQHRLLMVRIGQSLSSSDLSDLKYLCGDILAESAIGNVQTATDLFKLLEYNGFLGPDYYAFIKEGFMSMGRNDLANLLPNPLEKNVKDCHSQDKPKTYQETQYYHRNMLVSIAGKMRSEDISKLIYVSTGRVSAIHDADSTSVSLNVFALLEEAKMISSGNYTLLSDFLHQIGRHDLADFLLNLPGRVPSGFSMKRQALSLKMECLNRRKCVYRFYREKLIKMTQGDYILIHQIHSVGIENSIKALGHSEQINKSTFNEIPKAFNALKILIQSIGLESDQFLKLLQENIGFLDKSYPCPLADAAHQSRLFILKVSCELLGKEKVKQVHQLNGRIEHLIDISCEVTDHIYSLLTNLASVLRSVPEKGPDRETFRKDLIKIYVGHKKYIIALFPKLSPFISVENLKEFKEIFKVEELDTSMSLAAFNGIGTVPAYSILLNALASLTGFTVNSEEVLRKITSYLQDEDHDSFGDFIQRFSGILQESITSFTEDIIELDGLCAPLIRELVSF